MEGVDLYKYLGVMISEDDTIVNRNQESCRTRETSDETFTLHFIEQSNKNRNKN